MALPRVCPDCDTSLSSARPQSSGRIRCPGCSRTIVPDDDSDDRPSRSERSGSRSRSDRSRSARQKAKSPAQPIIIGCVVGLLLLGGIAGIWYATKKTGSSKTTDSVANDSTATKPNPSGNIESPNSVNRPQPPIVWKEPIRASSAGNGSGGSIPLQELKAASVYIKGFTGQRGATGSGFVVQASGDTAYIVTNHHVVTDLKIAAFRHDPNAVIVRAPPFPRPPSFPRPPVFMPRPPIGPFGPGPQGPFAPNPGQNPEPTQPQGTGLPFADLSVVFRAGTPQEQTVKGTLMADNAEDDLAVLKVSGVRDVPNPIDISRSPKLVETMTVLAFGFPFGAALDPNKPNPAITVTKGAVTSIRQDKSGELEVVQIDADLNPGNSGGPVVDESGALVGVAVAKIKNSRIGLAVPVHKLNKMLASIGQ